MKRPCTCDRCTIGQPKKLGPGGDCGLCWAWYHSPGHRELWGGDPSEAVIINQPRPPVPSELRPTLAPSVRTSSSLQETCRHFGPSTGEVCDCVEGCRGVRLKVFQCGVYGKCTVAKRCDEDKAKGCCRGCPSYEPIPLDPPAPTAHSMVENYRPLKWSYGVTTVPERRDNLLRTTLSSLQKGGWDNPRLFIDGYASRDYSTWEHLTTCHDPPLRTFGNWALALWELYVREPTADRYAIFQDDMICCRNLRAYLDACPYPERGYLNLLTFLTNEPVIAGKPVGWYEAGRLECSDPDHHLQTGRGAVALVFDRETVVTLLSSRHFVERPMEPFRGHRSIDGGIVTAMNKAGYREYIHNPSLVQHVGHVSSMGNLPYPQAQTFPGEDFDALDLLREMKKV